MTSPERLATAGRWRRLGGRAGMRRKITPAPPPQATPESQARGDHPALGLHAREPLLRVLRDRRGVPRRLHLGVMVHHHRRGCWTYLDGRVARVTRTGSAFGAELDSLTDAVSFGVAPALILVLLYFPESDWSWLIGFAYVAAVAVLRLARFNVEQGGEARTPLSRPAVSRGRRNDPGHALPLHHGRRSSSRYLAGLPWPADHGDHDRPGLDPHGEPHSRTPRMPPLDFHRSARDRQRRCFASCRLSRSRPSLFPYYCVLPGHAVGVCAVGPAADRSSWGCCIRLPERDPLLDEEPRTTRTRTIEPREVDYHELTHEPGPPEDEPYGPDVPDSGAAEHGARQTDIIEWKEKPLLSRFTVEVLVTPQARPAGSAGEGDPSRPLVAGVRRRRRMCASARRYTWR